MGTAVSLVRARQNDNISSALEWVIGTLVPLQADDLHVN